MSGAGREARKRQALLCFETKWHRGVYREVMEGRALLLELLPGVGVLSHSRRDFPPFSRAENSSNRTDLLRRNSSFSSLSSLGTQWEAQQAHPEEDRLS